MLREGQLSPVEKAWAVAKTWENSNNFQKYHADGNILKVQSLYDYYANGDYTLREAKLPTHTPSKQTMRFYVIEIADTSKEGISGDGKLRLFVDPAGHDIKLSYMDKNGQTQNILAPNLLKNNTEMLKALSLGTSLSPEDVAKMITPKTTEEMVESIDKYNTVGFRSAEDALVRTYDHDKGRVDNDPEKVKAQTKEQATDEEQKQEAEKQEQEQEMNEQKEQEHRLTEKEIDEKMAENTDIPQDQYSTVRKICIDNNLDPSKLKQTITVNSPETVSNKIDDRHTMINENGGPVTLLRFRNDDVSKGGADTVIMIQDEQQLPHDETNDGVLTEAMEQQGGNNVNVVDFEDQREEEMIQKLYLAEKQFEDQVEEIDEQCAREGFSDEEHDMYIEQAYQEHSEIVMAIGNKLYPQNKQVTQEMDKAMEDANDVARESEAGDITEESQEGTERTLGDTSMERRGFTNF